MAWLAALIDGEGSVMLNTRWDASQRKGTLLMRPTVSVSNTDLRLLQACVDRTGIDRIYGHKRKAPSTNKAGFTWRMNVTDIRLWGPELEPHLICKREQMRLLLDALALKAVAANPSTRVADHQAQLLTIQTRIQQLNSRGRASGHQVGHQ